jgi:hypothetical protein
MMVPSSAASEHLVPLLYVENLHHVEILEDCLFSPLLESNSNAASEPATVKFHDIIFSHVTK